MTISGGKIPDMKNRASSPFRENSTMGNFGRRWFNQKYFLPGNDRIPPPKKARRAVFAAAPARVESFLSFPGFSIGFPHRRISNIRPPARADLPRGRWVQKWTPNLGNQISSGSRNQNCCQKEISWLVQNFNGNFVQSTLWRRRGEVFLAGGNELWLIHNCLCPEDTCEWVDDDNATCD